jgi:hypothetical protein
MTDEELKKFFREDIDVGVAITQYSQYVETHELAIRTLHKKFSTGKFLPDDVLDAIGVSFGKIINLVNDSANPAWLYKPYFSRAQVSVDDFRAVIIRLFREVFIVLGFMPTPMPMSHTKAYPDNYMNVDELRARLDSFGSSLSMSEKDFFIKRVWTYQFSKFVAAMFRVVGDAHFEIPGWRPTRFILDAAIPVVTRKLFVDELYKTRAYKEYQTSNADHPPVIIEDGENIFSGTAREASGECFEARKQIITYKVGMGGHAIGVHARRVRGELWLFVGNIGRNVYSMHAGIYLYKFPIADQVSTIDKLEELFLTPRGWPGDKFEDLYRLSLSKLGVPALFVNLERQSGGWCIHHAYELCLYAHFLCNHLLTEQPAESAAASTQGIFDRAMAEMRLNCAHRYFVAQLDDPLALRLDREFLKRLYAQWQIFSTGIDVEQTRYINCMTREKLALEDSEVAAVKLQYLLTTEHSYCTHVEFLRHAIDMYRRQIAGPQGLLDMAAEKEKLSRELLAMLEPKILDLQAQIARIREQRCVASKPGLMAALGRAFTPLFHSRQASTSERGDELQTLIALEAQHQQRIVEINQSIVTTQTSLGELRKRISEEHRELRRVEETLHSLASSPSVSTVYGYLAFSPSIREQAAMAMSAAKVTQTTLPKAAVISTVRPVEAAVTEAVATTASGPRVVL